MNWEELGENHVISYPSLVALHLHDNYRHFYIFKQKGGKKVLDTCCLDELIPPNFPQLQRAVKPKQQLFDFMNCLYFSSLDWMEEDKEEV